MMHGDWQCGCGALNAGVASRCYRCGAIQGGGSRWGAATADAAGGGEPQPAQAHLAGVSVRQGGRVMLLDPARPLTVGRSATADLVLDGEATVASQHARIVPMPPYYAIEDLESG